MSILSILQSGDDLYIIRVENSCSTCFSYDSHEDLIIIVVVFFSSTFDLASVSLFRDRRMSLDVQHT